MIRSYDMNTITIDLQNCYGIRELKHNFDFSKNKAYAIYAPNGSMKSSFAETFKNIAVGTKPQDRIFPKRVSVYKIKDESGSDLPPESILVLRPYDEYFGHTEKTSTLLVNNDLRKEYEQLHVEIDAARVAFIKQMSLQSQSKKDVEREISLAFMKRDDKEAFYLALDRIKNEVNEQKDAPFANVIYDQIFDDKVLKILESKDCKAAIKDYITRYNELLDGSIYFKKGVFEYYNAGQIAKTLADNGFFDAKHTITLNGDEKVEIRTKKDLELMIQDELEKITEDTELKKKFVAIKKLIGFPFLVHFEC